MITVCFVASSGLSNEMDMERALKTAKKELAAKDGAQLAREWEVQKAVGMYHLVVERRRVDKRYDR